MDWKGDTRDLMNLQNPDNYPESTGSAIKTANEGQREGQHSRPCFRPRQSFVSLHAVWAKRAAA